MKKLMGAFGSFFIIIMAIMLGKYIANASYTRESTMKPQTYEHVSGRSDSTIDEVSKGLEVGAKAINLQAPFMIDENTRLEKVYVMPMAKMVYEITFPYLSKNEIALDWIRTDYKSELVQGACSNEEMNATMERGGQFIYLLSDKDGENIMEITVSQNECSTLRR